MSDPRIPPTPPILLARLRAVRGRIRLHVGLEGMASLLRGVLVFVAISLPVDFFFRLDIPQRAILLAGAVGGLLLLAWRRMGRPLLFPLTDAFLCRVIETRHPSLRGLLLGTLEFTTAPAPGASPAMVEATIRAGTGAAESVSPTTLVPPARIRRLLLHGGALLLPLLGACVAMPETLSLWMRRNLLLAETPWPRHTHLSVDGLHEGRLGVPEGGDLQLVVHATGRIPDGADIRHRTGGQAVQREAMRRSGDAFTMAFRNVVEPMRMRVSAGDGDTGWFDVVVLPRPRLETLTLLCHPPDHTRQPPQELPPGRDLYTVPAHSRLVLDATATQPLASFHVLFEGEPIAQAAAAESPTRFRLELGADRVRSGTYTLVFEDTEGIPPARFPSFRLRLRPDQAPVVQVRGEGIGGILLDRARIPLRILLRDDYGISAAALEVTGSFEGIEGTVFEMELPLPADAETRTELPLEAVVDLQTLDRSLPPGTLLTIHLTASDTDTLDGPNTGAGSLPLRIVSEEEFLADLQLREQTVRQALLGLIRAQGELLEAARIHQTTPPDPAALRRDERRQRLLARQVEPLADRLQGMVAEIRANRFEAEDGPYQSRLGNEGIRPLVERALPAIPRAATALDAATPTGIPPEVYRQHLQTAIEEQGIILDALRHVESQMARWESMQEAVTILRELIDRQKRIHDETRKQHEEGVESLFD